MQTTYSLDVKAMLRALFRNLLTLVLFTAVGGGLGFGLSYLQTPLWRATIQFDAPKVPDLGNYFSLFSTYQLMSGGDAVSYKMVKDERGNFLLAPEIANKAEQLAIDNSYNEFKRNLNSPNVLKGFLSQNDIVKKLAVARNQSEVVLINEISEQYLFQAASKSTPVDRLSVTAANPEDAQRLLSGFVQYANGMTQETLNNELIAKWKVLFQQVKQAADENLGAIAQGSSVERQDWAGKLKMMRAVQPLDNQMTAYRLVKSVDLPINPESPNRPIWAMIGLLSGLLLGIFCLSFIRMMKMRTKQNEQTH